ncbi:hypothetical protein BDV93DRAFT_565013 [Ceratobasidium sp. AG-I]|nr:hypothetical protein BDV93DRAFT_565013 [Ceratobasidium sp. AG-I]
MSSLSSSSLDSSAPPIPSATSTRTSHIVSSPECCAAQRAALEQEVQKRLGARLEAEREAVRKRDRARVLNHAPKPCTSSTSSPAASPNKRPRVTLETVEDEDVGDMYSRKVAGIVFRSREPSPSEPGPSRQEDTPADERCFHYYKGLYVEEFPDALAGAPISSKRAPLPDLDKHMRKCGDMANPKYFNAAELLMTSSLSDADKDRHLKSEMYEGRMPWKGAGDMLAAVDRLTHGPEFEVSDIEIFDRRGRRMQFMVSRDIIRVLRDMFANRELKDDTFYAPVRFWTSAEMEEQVYGDARASLWWWEEQNKLAKQGKRDATILPLIVATDQTVLSVMCGGQKAYPVYVTVGNINKDARRKPSKRAMALLVYLPVDAFEDITNDAKRRRLKAELVHRAMEKMLATLCKASKNGVEMWCPDGRLRRVFPRVAAYTADWPEQNLQSCTSEGSCPVCKAQYTGRGNLEVEADLRTRTETLGAICLYWAQNNTAELTALRLKVIWPWWGDLPHVNLATCFTPDLLHQLYQGVFKTHLLRWLKHLVGDSKLDERFMAMPQAEGMRHFTKGITRIGQWTGHESKQMMAQIMPVVIGDLGNEVGQMVLAIVNFMFKAHGSSMTETDLKEMEADLATFHRLKNLLVAQGVYQSSTRFDKLPKLHMLKHYVHTIRQLGTPDGYNTETPEHLHIEYAKFHGALQIHRAYMNRWLGLERNVVEENEDKDEREAGREEVTGHVAAKARGIVEGSGIGGTVASGLAKQPRKGKVMVKDLVQDYGASNIIPEIKNFLGRRRGIPSCDGQIALTNEVKVWPKLYLHHELLPFAPFDPPHCDVVRATAPVRDHRGRVTKQAVRDVALFREKPNHLRSNGTGDEGEKHGLTQYRAGRVLSFFTLPGHLKYIYSGQLAYMEVFKPFDESVSQFSGMHSTRPDYDSSHRRRTLVIPVTDIDFACHLVPKFHKLDPTLHLTAGMDLFPHSDYFWLNHFYNHYFYQFVQHWWRTRPRLRDRLLRIAGR